MLSLLVYCSTQVKYTQRERGKWIAPTDIKLRINYLFLRDPTENKMSFYKMSNHPVEKYCQEDKKLCNNEMI